MKNFHRILVILLMVLYFSPKADARIRKDSGSDSTLIAFPVLLHQVVSQFKQIG